MNIEEAVQNAAAAHNAADNKTIKPHHSHDSDAIYYQLQKLRLKSGVVGVIHVNVAEDGAAIEGDIELSESLQVQWLLRDLMTAFVRLNIEQARMDMGTYTVYFNMYGRIVLGVAVEDSATIANLSKSLRRLMRVSVGLPRNLKK